MLNGAVAARGCGEHSTSAGSPALRATSSASPGNESGCRSTGMGSGPDSGPDSGPGSELGSASGAAQQSQKQLPCGATGHAEATAFPARLLRGLRFRGRRRMGVHEGHHDSMGRQLRMQPEGRGTPYLQQCC